MFTALVSPTAVFSSPNLFHLLPLQLLCTFLCITYQIASLSSAIRRNAVGL